MVGAVYGVNKDLAQRLSHRSATILRGALSERKPWYYSLNPGLRPGLTTGALSGREAWGYSQYPGLGPINANTMDSVQVYTECEFLKIKYRFDT